MIGALTNHLWQSTTFALAAGLLTLAFRKNRAQVRYWLWFSASLKFFIPFSLLLSLGSNVPAAKKLAAPPAVSLAMEQIAQPFEESAPRAPSPPSPRDWKPIALLLSWACGFASIAMIRFRGWLRIRAALSASTPVNIPAPIEVRASPGLLEPGVVGFLRPILLLPERIEERLTPPQLEAVLAHELCHVRRRDNLFAAVHMLVEATFWFHPLIWWIGARLVEERERACDEAVLSQGSEPRDYAEGILKVCKLYVESPLTCVSGVTGSDLKKRIQAIMTKRVAHDLNFAKKLALAVAAIAAIAAPIAAGILNAPAIRAQSTPAPTPKWEVVSIRPAKDNDCGGPGPDALKGAPKGPPKGGFPGPPSPGRLTQCIILANVIPQAYVYNATGQAPQFGQLQLVAPIPIEGGPAWINSDLYQINAKAEGTPSREMMMGPMMQALLEDRFKLKIHRETRELPAYALTVTKGGPKIQPLKGGCAPMTIPPTPIAPGQADCGPTGMERKGPNLKWGFVGDFDDISNVLTTRLDRPVINKTGLAGVFNFHLEYAIDENTPESVLERFPAAGDPSDPAAGPSIFTAVQEQLGLKLEPAKAPREFLVIDHVERPSEN